MTYRGCTLLFLGLYLSGVKRTLTAGACLVQTWKLQLQTSHRKYSQHVPADSIQGDFVANRIPAGSTRHVLLASSVHAELSLREKAIHEDMKKLRRGRKM